MISSHQRITILLAILLVGPACKTRDSYYCEGAPKDNCSLDAADVGCTTFSKQLDTCALGTGTDLTISGSRIYNTDTHVLEDAVGGNAVPVMHTLVTNNGDMMDVIVANSFTLTAGSNLRVVGSVAFGIVATGALTIEGTLNAVGGDPGIEAAGARQSAACEGMGGGTHNGGAPGGGGGGYQGTGGNGGPGDTGMSLGASGGKSELRPAAFPRGGCPGGEGGSAGGGTRGNPGHGGGAVDLISAVSITIAGEVNAGGRGGLGGVANGGGGGGGSGGMIVLEAPDIAGTGGVAANGGGGGGGGGSGGSGATPGGAGKSGAVNITAADGGAGGMGNESGSTGGAGGVASSVDGVTVIDILNTGGGGGGGGAAGYIRVIGATPKLAVISPAPL